MAVTMVKEKKHAAPAGRVALNDEERGLIEQLAVKQEKIEENKAKLKKLKLVQEIAELEAEAGELEARVKDILAAGIEDLETREEKAGIYVAELGKAKRKREFKDGAAKAIHRMLKEEFWALVHLQLGEVDDYLTKPQREEVVTEGFDLDKEGRKKRNLKITRVGK